MGDVEPALAGAGESSMRHHPCITVALTFTRTPIGGQFGWGATPSKKYQGCPMVNSCESETHKRVSRAKVGLTRSRIASDRERKLGSNEPICLFGEGY